MEPIILRYVADGNKKRLDLGFIPLYCRAVINYATGETPNIYEWHEWMEDEATALYGILHTGSSGAITIPTTAATGITALDEQYQGVLVPDPAGGAAKFMIPEEYSTTQDYSSTYTQTGTGDTVTCTARSASAPGTVVWPPTRNGYVYELATATGLGTTEPTWPTTIGKTVTDGGSNVWTCRTANVVSYGAKGIIVGATTQTDGHINCVIAWKGGDYVNAGDSADTGNAGFVPLYPLQAK